MAKISTFPGTFQDLQIRYDSEAGVTYLRTNGFEVPLEGPPEVALTALARRIAVEAGFSKPVLPARQKETLSTVSEYITEHGRSPSIREVALARGVSPATVHQCLAALARKGCIKIRRGQFRGIEVVQS
jgi:hypothetical protein